MNARISHGLVNTSLTRLLLAVTTAILATGCASSSSLVNLWKNSEYPKEPMRNVLVLAFKRDATMRRIWEDGIAGEFLRRGVTATPSYRLFPDALPDSQQVVDAVQSHGYDGVLEAHKLPTQTGERYVPGYLVQQPVVRLNRWTRMYQTYYREVYQPGYTETEKIIRYQVNVWSPRGDGDLVWSGTTQTIDPTSSQDANRQISRLIVPELARSGVIPSATR